MATKGGNPISGLQYISNSLPMLRVQLPPLRPSRSVRSSVCRSLARSLGRPGQGPTSPRASERASDGVPCNMVCCSCIIDGGLRSSFSAS